MLSRFSPVQLFTTLWTVAHQAPLSIGSSRQEHWSKLPCHSPRDLPDPGIEPGSLSLLHWAGRLFTSSATWESILISDRLKPTSASVRAASPNSLSEARHFPSEPSPFFPRVKTLLLGGPLSLSLLISRNQIKEGKNEAGQKEMV